MNQTKEKLLQKIKEDLNDLSNTDPVYKKALRDLNQINAENSIDPIKAALVDCYHKLITLEKTGQLTVNETVLLNDIENWKDFIISSNDLNS